MTWIEVSANHFLIIYKPTIEDSFNVITHLEFKQEDVILYIYY